MYFLDFGMLVVLGAKLKVHYSDFRQKIECQMEQK